MEIIEATPAHIPYKTVNILLWFFPCLATPSYSISTKLCDTTAKCVSSSSSIRASYGQIYSPRSFGILAFLAIDWRKRRHSGTRGGKTCWWIRNASHRKCLHTQTDYSMEEWRLKMSAMTHIYAPSLEVRIEWMRTRHMQVKRPSKKHFSSKPHTFHPPFSIWPFDIEAKCEKHKCQIRLKC